MELISQIKDTLDQLSDKGWATVFSAHGLDITAPDLSVELSRNISNTIDRSFPGFEDFSLEGNQGITPSIPAHSLLLHAFRSPNVIWQDKQRTAKITEFASREQQEIIENYVYATANASLAGLQAEHGNNLAVVIFSSEYRAAIQTPSKKHADMVFAQSGVARIGTEAALYDTKRRCYDPLTQKAQEVRVLPAKYDAYIAIKQQASPALLGTHFDENRDGQLNVWKPLHKLFSGNECLSGMDLNIALNCFHSNEKIKRVHRYLMNDFNFDTGASPSDLTQSPFIYHDDIAEMDGSVNCVVPQVHGTVVKKAEFSNQLATLSKNFVLELNPSSQRYQLLNNGNSIANFSSTLELRSSAVGGGAFPRKVPEYMHVRSKVVNQDIVNLNAEPNVVETIAEEKFDALHYVDYSGDGFVTVNINHTLLSALPKIPAYSMVAPPDFYPYVKQAEILDAIPKDLRDQIWSVEPTPLCDSRMLPNIETHPELNYPDITTFKTATALINGFSSSNAQRGGVTAVEQKLTTYLTDGAAGVFAPGWDTSFDYVVIDNQREAHFAAYGLGTPFAEDAKLCAALSSFWPAVAPDIARSYWPDAETRRTVIPLSDQEIGSGDSKGWDGEHGPRIRNEEGQNIITFKRFDYVDYTLNAAGNRFDYHRLANLDANGYLNRVISYAIVSRSSQLENGAILIGYQIDEQSGIHTYRFMLEYTELDTPEDMHVSLTIDREISLSIDSSLQIQRVS